MIKVTRTYIKRKRWNGRRLKTSSSFFYWSQRISCIILSPLLRGKHTGSYMELATFLSKSLRQCSYEARWSYCIGGRDIKGSIKKWAPSCSLWSTAWVERANRAKELASGFHFIPDRLNEAHGEGMGVTFSGWQAGCCMKRTERWREDCWWSREGDRRGAMGCLAAPVRSMPRLQASSLPSSQPVIVHFGVLSQISTSSSVLRDTLGSFNSGI